MCALSEDTFIGSASIIENGAFAVFFYQISLQRWCYNNLLYSFFFKKAEKVDSRQSANPLVGESCKISQNSLKSSRIWNKWLRLRWLCLMKHFPDINIVQTR